ncbi:MAG: leucine-rich repeat protein [Prevotella sp.]|nr:leucine-rich repeat protein [Prevotella sp.]
MKAKRFITLLVLMLSITGAIWAARTAPTLPTAQTLQSGKTYYLYNIDSQLFLHRYSTYGVNLDAVGSAITFTSRSDKGAGAYILQFADDYYLHLWNSDKNADSYEDNNSYQLISGNSSAYRIQKSSYASGYDASHYFGHDVTSSDASSLRSDLASGNITWRLINADAGALYCARVQLYNAMASAEEHNIYVADYESLYNTSTDAAAIAAAATELTKSIELSTNITSPDWSDYQIRLAYEGANPWNVSGSNIYATRRDVIENNVYTLKATVTVDVPSTFVYECDGGFNGSAVVYVDGVETEAISRYMLNYGGFNKRYFEELTPGTHTITWVYTAENNDNWPSSFYLRNMGVEKTPTITVSLPEPGSLVTEVRHQLDRMEDVRKIIINGAMNDTDWASILTMTSLFTIDLSGATFTTVPQGALSKDQHSSQLSFLHEVKLPNMVQTISNNAFKGTALESITIPSTVQTIGEEAFRNTRLRSLTLPTTMSSIGSHAFRNIPCLATTNFPTNLTRIPTSCFEDCSVLQGFELSENVDTIGNGAFRYCYAFETDIPLTISRFEDHAFGDSGIRQVEFAENADILYNCFENCDNLRSIIFPTTFSNVNWYLHNIVINCDNLTDITFRSGTVIMGDYYRYFLNGMTKSAITLHVPNHLVSGYMSDAYWYECQVEGFSTASIPEFVITQPLKLGMSSRFDGAPSLTFKEDATFEISGDNSQTINNLYTETRFRGWEDIEKSTLVMSTCNNINIQGDYIYGYYLADANRWYFLSLPFDTKVGDLQLVEGGSYAIRYYDGAERATRGATGSSWKNYAANDIIPAGTGFIIQVSKRGYVNFKSQNNATKQYALKNMEFVKPMAKNTCESNAHKGWNLVGNPFQCYYNLHRLGFTAPITVWEDNKYVAYSPIDDDYAILPNEAFFVQCPDDLDDLTFPINGKQMTNVIEQENAARGQLTAVNPRKVMNIELSDGDNADKTRLVINSDASNGYELNRDAGKFLSNGVPQLYTIDVEGNEYAINERPIADGKVLLGMVIPTDGDYTISMTRSDMTKVMLTDLLTNTTINIAEQEYQFNATAGKLNSRFVITFEEGNAATGINGIESKTTESEVWYSIDGRKVSGNSVKKGIYIKDGKKVVVK